MPINPFSPAKLRGVTLRNRFLVAPMATQYADRQGRVTEAMVAYYRHLSLTGAGMIIVEAAAIAPDGHGWSRQLDGFSPDCREGLGHIAETIRDRGCVPLLQIHHAGRQALPPGRDGQTIAPSAIPCPVLQRPVRELAREEIPELVRKYTYTARMAMEAGFAGIELHGAHGYLLHQFVSPLTNLRRDEYGLQPGTPSRFPLEVVRSIRSAFPEMVLSYRISARDYLPRGLLLSDSALLAKALEGAGVDLIHVSGGNYASLHGPESIVGKDTPPGVFRSDARDLKHSLTIPVAVVGKIQEPSLAFEILTQEDADFIALGRVLLRDPDWISKAKGLVKTPVVPCLLCPRCHFHSRGCPDRRGRHAWSPFGFDEPYG